MADERQVPDFSSKMSGVEQLEQAAIVFANADASCMQGILDVLLLGSVTDFGAQVALIRAVGNVIDSKNPEHREVFDDALPALREIPAIRFFLNKIQAKMQSTTAQALSSEQIDGLLASKDVPKILGALTSGQVTGKVMDWGAQRSLSAAVANNATAEAVPKILETLTSGQVTDEIAQMRLSSAVVNNATAEAVPKILGALTSVQVTSTSALFYLSEAVEHLIDPATPEHQTAFRDALPTLSGIPGRRAHWSWVRIQAKMQSTTAPSTAFTNGVTPKPAVPGTNGQGRRPVTH